MTKELDDSTAKSLLNLELTAKFVLAEELRLLNSKIDRLRERLEVVNDNYQNLNVKVFALTCAFNKIKTFIRKKEKGYRPSKAPTPSTGFLKRLGELFKASLPIEETPLD